jgi:plasmid stabilization system protein ParE
MKKPTVRIVIANEAKADLKNIYYWIIEKTKSVQKAKNIRADIIQASKDIHFVEQYQVDEFLGEPFRRMVVRHYKIIYKPVNEKEIRILQIFDTYQSPNKMSV